MPDNSNKTISHQVIILAIPIIFSNLSRVIMSLADMAMVSRLGVNALAATGMGSLLLWMIMSMGIGVRTAVQTVSSRRLGQKIYPQCAAKKKRIVDDRGNFLKRTRHAIFGLVLFS